MFGKRLLLRASVLQLKDPLSLTLHIAKAVPPAFKGDFPCAQAPTQGISSAPAFELSILPVPLA